MARDCRLKSHLDGQAYHVMHRTVRQAFLFGDDVSKEWIYQEILALAEIYTVDLHAIAVMSNHYHMGFHVICPPRIVGGSLFAARFNPNGSNLD